MASNGSHADGSADAEKPATERLDLEVNERIQAVNAQRALIDLPEDLICECARPECAEQITLNAVEYRGLRAHGPWFLIAPSEQHFFPEVERIVVKDGGYWIVEKHDGAARIGEQIDAR